MYHNQPHISSILFNITKFLLIMRQSFVFALVTFQSLFAGSWALTTAGLNFTIYDGYFDDDVNWFDNNVNYDTAGGNRPGFTGENSGVTRQISDIGSGTLGAIPIDSSRDHYAS